MKKLTLLITFVVITLVLGGINTQLVLAQEPEEDFKIWIHVTLRGMDQIKQEEWRERIEDAVQLLNVIEGFEISLTEEFSEGNVYLQIVSEDYFKYGNSSSYPPCPNSLRSLGCAERIVYVFRSDGTYAFRGYATISGEAEGIGPIAHELIHALGMENHSSNRADLMFRSYLGVEQLSSRDLDSLEQALEEWRAAARGS